MDSLRLAFPCCPSFHLKGVFIGAFFLALPGGLEIDDLLFSIEGTVDAARHGRQLFERIPQFSKIPPSSAFTEEISSANTASFPSWWA